MTIVVNLGPPDSAPLAAPVSLLETRLAVEGLGLTQELEGILRAVAESMAHAVAIGRSWWWRSWEAVWVRESGADTRLVPGPLDPSTLSVRDGVDTEDAETVAPYVISRRSAIVRTDGDRWPESMSGDGYSGYVPLAQVSEWTAASDRLSGQWHESASGLFECTTPGTSGAVEPEWSSFAPGEEVADGSVSWTARDAVIQPPDLVEAALLTASAWHRHELEMPIGLRSQSGSEGQDVFLRPSSGKGRDDVTPPFPSTALSILQSYR